VSVLSSMCSFLSHCIWTYRMSVVRRLFKKHRWWNAYPRTQFFCLMYGILWNIWGCAWLSVCSASWLWLVLLVLSQEELLRLRRSAALAAVDSSAPILAPGTAIAPVLMPMRSIVFAFILALAGVFVGKFLVWMSNCSSTIQQICELVCVCHSPSPLPLSATLHSYFHLSFFKSHTPPPINLVWVILTSPAKHSLF